MTGKALKNILYYLTVPRCVCCREKLGIDDRALCADCAAEYKNAKNRSCSRCFKLLSECSCSNRYLKSHMMPRLVKLFRYKPSSSPNERIAQNELIYNIKRVKRRDLLDLISDEMIAAIENTVSVKDIVITNVPRKSGRVLKYGFDHSEEIARAISKKLGIQYVKLLKSKLKSPQKKLYGEERVKNARFDYLRRRKDITGKRVLLVDDIVTTGASMGACAMLIRALGAKEVVGVCMGITYRDDD